MQHSFWGTGQTGGLPLNVSTLGDTLVDAGYDTHFVGKWHLGFENASYHPLSRGFSSYYGYLGGGEDYLTHASGGYLDFHDGHRNAFEAVGSYSTTLFANRSIDLISAHSSSRPFALVLAFQAVHAPLQAPAEWVAKYTWIKNKKRRTMAAMTSCVDHEIGRVVAAMKAKDAGAFYQNSIIVVVADNGGPPYVANSNWPMRGGKWTLWEGGTHLTALVHGPGVGLPAKNFTGLMHHADWLHTLREAVGLSAPEHTTLMDGVSLWPTLLSTNASDLGPRECVVLNVDPTNQDVVNDAGGWSGFAGIVCGQWKLLLGWGGVPDSWCWPNQPNATITGEEGTGGLVEEGAQECRPPPNRTNSTHLCCPANDIHNAHADTSAACCSLCFAEPECAGFTWQEQSSKCFLKSSVAVCEACDSGTSGAVPGRSPSPSPSPSPYPGALTCGYSGAVPPLPMRTRPMLFDLVADPGEHNDLAAANPAKVTELQRMLAPFIAGAAWPLNAYSCHSHNASGCRGTAPMAIRARNAANAWVVWNGTDDR